MAARQKTLLPPFTVDGLLPPGTYQLTLDQLRDSHLVRKATYLSDWDEPWRGHLVDNLEILARQLWDCGIQDVYVDGSFVEDKPRPNDIDGYFSVDLAYFISRRLEQDLNARDPRKSWGWLEQSRREDPDSGKKQLPQWFEYSVELYPHYHQSSGILDEHGNEQRFPAAFRKSRRENKPKGIIRLIPD